MRTMVMSQISRSVQLARSANYLAICYSDDHAKASFWHDRSQSHMAAARLTKLAHQER